jgi:hypothetical protein
MSMRDTEDIPIFSEKPSYNRSISPPLFPRLKRHADGLDIRNGKAELFVLKSQMPAARYLKEENEVEDDAIATMKLIEGWCGFSRHSLTRRLLTPI